MIICGWLPADLTTQTGAVVAAMGRALRVHHHQTWEQSLVPGIGLGFLDPAQASIASPVHVPAISRDERFHLWMSGEVFNGSLLGLADDPEFSRTLGFRARLLSAFLEQGAPLFRRLDGHYQVVIWDAYDEVLALVNDRFGSIPQYWSASREGFAFGSGVRGVLMAPGVSAAPDLEAIQEAVTFGGFRLGDRTNVAAVKMLPMASMLKVGRGGMPSISRYWHWSDIQQPPARPMSELIDAAHGLWQRAVRRRLTAAQRPGQTLSGGLDSRAILAEAAPQAPQWLAITYGVPDCDDARYAQCAAAESRATWIFHPLYSGHDPDWLERRARLIQHTDGLIQLGDLMHLETVELQAALMDVNLSGYIGDAACGPNFDRVASAENVALRMPYYGDDLSWPWPKAVDWARTAVAALGGAAPRFALYEHKIAQSTNHLFYAPANWMRVRRPFLDYELFDFFNGQPAEVRQSLYWRMLRTRYPRHFAQVPNHATGLPVLSPRWRVQIARLQRGAWRELQQWMAKIGLPARPRVRNYTADHLYWSQPDARRRIEATVLRQQSVVCEVFGRKRVERTLRNWFERDAAPCQLIGALFVYEAYLRDLSSHLRSFSVATIDALPGCPSDSSGPLRYALSSDRPET